MTQTFETALSLLGGSRAMVPRQQDEPLLDYLDRLTLTADRLTHLEQVAYEACIAALEARTAGRQLARYTALIQADLDGAGISVQLTGGADLPEHHEQAIPESNPETSEQPEPDQTSNLEINSASEADLISDAERTREWALAQTGEFEAAHAAAELEIMVNSAKRYLCAVVSGGLLNRVEGTGRPGVPSRYTVRAATPAVPTVQPSSEVAARPADDASDSISASSESKVGFTPDSERLWAWVQTLDGNEFAAADASDELEIPEKSAGKYLADLMKLSKVDRVSGTGRPGVPSRYVVSGPEALPEEPEQPAAQPLALQVLEEPCEDVPSNSKASTPDERAVLERMGDGALYKVDHLIHWLQIARTRIERALDGLCQAGLIGRRGELFVVIPEELAAAAQ